MLYRKLPVKTGEIVMAMNGISAEVPAVQARTRRPRIIVSGLALRILIAFILSWLIVLAFFATGVVSH
jgi:hypothetical protein